MTATMIQPMKLRRKPSQNPSVPPPLLEPIAQPIRATDTPAGYAIGSNKGRGTEGFWLGFLLGFIGWIIVAVMELSDEIQQQRAIALASANQLGCRWSRSGESGADSACPWCAEQIKPAARLRRYCGRDVEPMSEGDSLPSDGDLDRVEIEYPDQYEAVAARLRALPTQPSIPARWLSELCKRIADGSPPEAAASRIPLDWNGPLPEPARRLPGAVTLADRRRQASSRRWPATFRLRMTRRCSDGRNG